MVFDYSCASKTPFLFLHHQTSIYSFHLVIVVLLKFSEGYVTAKVLTFAYDVAIFD